MSVAFQPRPKLQTWRSEAYRRLVAAMNCIHCGRAGPSQCAHSDFGKGGGIKSDDRGCFPLCADTPGRNGCHALIGARGMFNKEQRRVIEQKHAAATRDRIKRDGLWKPEWPEFTEEQAA